MHSRKTRAFSLSEFAGFGFQIQYSETDRASHVFEIDLHTHDVYELYVNLSGDVSFLVENQLYTLSRGEVVLTRPGQQHHCVYRSDAVHQLFWILFDAGKNPEIAAFVEREIGTGCIRMTDAGREEFIDLCGELMREDASDALRWGHFWRMLMLLRAGAAHRQPEEAHLPEDLARILACIESHITEPLQVRDIARTLYISESTIQRRFLAYLGMKPAAYLRSKKLELAAKLLREGASVLDAGLGTGFSDNSHFIRIFKERYGVTPLAYRKSRENT